MKGKDPKSTLAYRLLDTGDLLKLEQWGSIRMVRPCSQAMWQPAEPSSEWQRAEAQFSRDGGNAWKISGQVPKEWVVEIQGLKFRVAPTDFGHVGVFPEHSGLWQSMEKAIASQRPAVPQVLNLFAYSGGATLAAARAGARVCHLDASKGMVAWARDNALLNGLEKAPIRWIVDDVIKFLQREVKRGVRYDGIILDPPSFGRGARGEVFKIEKDLHQILSLCREVLVPKPLFVFFTSHTPGMTPLVMRYLLEQMMGEGAGGFLSEGEMLIPSLHGRALPAGSYAKWMSVCCQEGPQCKKD